MSSILGAAIVVMLAIPAIGQEPARAPEQQPKAKGKPATTQPAGAPAERAGIKQGSISSADSQFVAEAASGGMMEVKSGELAQQKSSNDKIKHFGQELANDHNKANDELKKIASEKGIDLPERMNSEHEALINSLSNLSGDEFDRKFVEEQVRAHRETIDKFQHEGQHGQDPQLKRFASKTIPTLQRHLKTAESLQRQISSSGRSEKREGRK